VRGLGRAGTTGGGLLAAVGVATVLAACAAPVAGTGSQAPVPPGTQVFATRPQSADCSRVDMAGLRDLSAVAPPAAQQALVPLEADPELKWATCVGLQEVADPSPSPSGTASASPKGQQAVWLLSFATSEAATSEEERMSTRETASGFRALVRPARLGNAKAEVLMDVRAEDHQTLLVVTVFDPRTGRPAAKCGLAAARGDRADDAANWCLRQLSDQLLRPAAARTTPARTSAG
jgi:hypothetical protein